MPDFELNNLRLKSRKETWKLGSELDDEDQLMGGIVECEIHEKRPSLSVNPLIVLQLPGPQE